MVTAQWHLIKGTTETMICTFSSENIASEWLEKQIREFPSGYFVENRCRIDRYPPLPIMEGQVDMFELLNI